MFSNQKVTLIFSQLYWEREKAKGEEGGRGWDGIQWTWAWVNSGRWWGTGRPGVLQSTGSQRIRDDSANEQQTHLYSGVDTLLCTSSFCCNPYPVCLPTGCLLPILSPYHSQLCIVQPEAEQITSLWKWLLFIPLHHQMGSVCPVSYKGFGL